MGLFDFLNDNTAGAQPANNPFAPPQPRYGSNNTAGPAPWQSGGTYPFGGQSSSTPTSGTPYTNPFGGATPNHRSTGPGPKFISRATEEEIRQAWPAAIRRYQLQTEQGNSNVPQIDNSLVPRVTQEQRKAYTAIKHLPIHGRRIYGEPGSGLSESNFGQDEVRSGTEGEQIFAKLLSRDGILDRCVSFWSMSRPTTEGERDDSGADIDCALLIDNHLLLIDVKNYRAGLAYHTLIPDKAMFCVYPAARVVAQKPYIFSVNMNWARNNLYEYLGSRCPGLTIDTFVVLVPGESGEATLDSDITWPGGIPAYSYSAFLSVVNAILPANQGFVRRTPLEGFLASMVKHYNCSPISPTAPVDENAWPKPTFDDDRDIDQLNHDSKSGSRRKSSKGSSSRSHKGSWGDTDNDQASEERRSSSGSRSRKTTNSKPSASDSRRSSGSSNSGSSSSQGSRSANGSARSTGSSSSGSATGTTPQAEDKPRTSRPTRSGSSATTNNSPFGSSSSVPLSRGWLADDVDDDDDWVPPSKRPKVVTEQNTQASTTSANREHNASAGQERASRTTRTAGSTSGSPLRRDPFARPDEPASRATGTSTSTSATGSATGSATHSRTATSSNRRTTRSTAGSARNASNSNQQYTINQVPQIDVASLSYTCGVDPNMKPVSLSLQGVSGVVAAGTSGMGEITNMLFMTVLMAKRADVFVRFLDCKDTAYLDDYQPAFTTLVRRSQGLDALLREVQAVKSLVDTRSFLVKRLQPNGDYWALDAQRRLKPLMVFVHECGNLFNPDTSNGPVSEDDRKTIESITALLQHIIEHGRQAGVIVVLSTQQPNPQNLPKSLVDACQMRLCFGAVDAAVATAVFGDRFSAQGNPTAQLTRSHAVISMPDKTEPDIRFYTVAKPVLEQLLGESAQA